MYQLVERNRAKYLILQFTKRHKGETIRVNDLTTNRDIFSVILTDTYLNVVDVLGDVGIALDRAVENAIRQKEDNYETFKKANAETEFKFL